MPARPDSLITALGFTRNQERLYVRLLSQSGRELVSVAAALLRDPDDLAREIEPFVRDGIVRLQDGQVHVSAPDVAVGAMLRESAETVARTEARLRDLAAAVPFLSSTTVRPRTGEVHGVEPLDGERSSGGNVPGLLSALILQTSGDLLQLRPDQWRTTVPLDPEVDPMAVLLRKVAAQGRRLRTVYPVLAQQEAPEVLAYRASLGEEIRLVPEVATRMLILGRTHAILPEPLGYMDSPRSLVRQRGLVELLTLYFDELWNRASPLPPADGPAPSTPGADQRRFLLELMAGGAQDEQIARRLGISLRTVRRRVADVLSELGAESRFQAGVEAGRRGWI